MSNIGSFAVLFILLTIFVVGLPVILDMLTEDYLGDFAYFYETLADNDTLTNCTGNYTFFADHISEAADGWLYLTYAGGNESDLVYVNGYYVGNLTPPSPDNITVDADYLTLNSTATFICLNNSLTNLTAGNLTYYSWDYCDYGEDSCAAMKVIRDSSVAVSGGLGQLPLLFGAFLLIFGGVWLWGASR